MYQKKYNGYNQPNRYGKGASAKQTPVDRKGEIYRFVVSLDKKRLFLFSFSTVLLTVIIFFTGFLSGKAIFSNDNPLTAEDSGVVNASSDSAFAKQSNNGIEAGENSLNTLIEGSGSVNQASDFNTNDLIFENILSDEEIEGELSNSKGAEDNNSYNQVTPVKKPVSPTKARQVPRSVPSESKISKRTETVSKPTPKKPITTSKQNVANAKPVSKSPLKKTRGVANVNTLNKSKSTVYEEYPQKGKTYYYVQLMTTGDLEKGRRFSDKLRSEGFLTKLVETVVREATFYVIVVGLYKDKPQAKKHLTRFKTAPRYGQAFKDAFLRSYSLENALGGELGDTGGELGGVEAPGNIEAVSSSF